VASRAIMAETRLTVTHTGKENILESQTPQGARFTFDSEGVAGASPVQYLVASTGACALMDVDIILRKKRLSYANLRVECVGERVKEGESNPVKSIKLVFRVDGDVPKKAFDDAVRLAVEKYCSVEATLRKPTPVAFETVVG
jgi:putative redox protein